MIVHLTARSAIVFLHEYIHFYGQLRAWPTVKKADRRTMPWLSVLCRGASNVPSGYSSSGDPMTARPPVRPFPRNNPQESGCMWALSMNVIYIQMMPKNPWEILARSGDDVADLAETTGSLLHCRHDCGFPRTKFKPGRNGRFSGGIQQCQRCNCVSMQNAACVNRPKTITMGI